MTSRGNKLFIWFFHCPKTSKKTLNIMNTNLSDPSRAKWITWLVSLQDWCMQLWYVVAYTYSKGSTKVFLARKKLKWCVSMQYYYKKFIYVWKFQQFDLIGNILLQYTKCFQEQRINIFDLHNETCLVKESWFENTIR